jgi:hypothetical protein
MTRMLAFVLILGGCVSDRPQALDVGDNEEVVGLPNGGVLILRRAVEARERECYVRARNFRGLVPLPCDQAEMVRP